MNNTKKKVSIVMFGLKTGGAELQFLELSKYLNEKYDFQVYVFAHRGNLDKEFKKNNIKLNIFDYKTKIGLIRALAMFLFEIRKNKPDVIISTSFVGNISAYIAKKLFKIGKIVSFQTIAKCMTRFKRSDAYILNDFDEIIAGANQIAKYLQEHLGSRKDKVNINVIHNWVDFENKIVTKNREETLKQFNISLDKVIIGNVGRLHIQKGQRILLEAVSKMKNIDKVLLCIVGEGDERTDLEALVTQLGIEDNILLLGEQNGDDYLNLMNAFDIYTQPSLFEGLPRTLLDSMYFAKPIVVSDADGNIEAIENEKNGLVVKVGDSQLLSVALDKLVLNSDLCYELAKKANETVIKKFDMKKQFMKIDSLL